MTQTRKSRLTTVAEVVGIAVGIVGLLITAVTLAINLPKDPTDDTDDSGELTTAPPIVTTSPDTGDPVDKSFEFELFDDFSGSTINSKKWGRGSGFDTVPPLIYAQDGLLNMQITPEHGSGENSASLQANLPRPARAISFEMIVLSSEGLNDGGGSAVISSRDSHNHKVAFGPGGDGFPGMEYFICNKESGCDDGVYEDFDHPGRSQLQLQQRYNVLIQQSDTGWSFQVDGFPEATAQLEDGPIQSFDLSLYSFGEGVFHVAVDNVKIDYAT